MPARWPRRRSALNKYNFGSLTLGQDSGNLTSTIADPAYFATVAGALGTDPNGASADGTTARHVQINVTADAPLLFWSLLSLGASRKTPIAAQALAGVSAPLVHGLRASSPSPSPPRTSTDPVNFGLGDPTADVHYTFYYNCTGTAPTFLPNSGQSTAYTIINRYDAASTTVPDESDQLFRLGAAGLASSTTPNPTGSPIPIGCAGINDPLEAVWNSPTFSAVPPACSGAALPQVASAALCGLYERFDNQTQPGVCTTSVTDYSALQPAFQPDTDVVTGQGDIYSSYSGNGRRVITVTVVDALAPNTATPMTVLGFRQFLVQPNPDGTFFDPSDAERPFRGDLHRQPDAGQAGVRRRSLRAELSGSGEFGSGEGGTAPMRRGRSGSVTIELAMWLPIIFLLLAGIIQFGKITYIYYSLQKTVTSYCQLSGGAERRELLPRCRRPHDRRGHRVRDHRDYGWQRPCRDCRSHPGHVQRDHAVHRPGDADAGRLRVVRLRHAGGRATAGFPHRVDAQRVHHTAADSVHSVGPDSAQAAGRDGIWRRVVRRRRSGQIVGRNLRCCTARRFCRSRL